MKLARAKTLLAIGLFGAACSGTNRRSASSADTKAGTVQEETQTLSDLRESLNAGRVTKALHLAATLEREGEEIDAQTIERLARLVDKTPLSQYPKVPPSLAASIVIFKSALVAFHRGDRESAQKLLLVAGQDPRLDAIRAHATEVILGQPATVDLGLIAVLLPMSGEFASLGKSALHGIELATPEESEFKLRVYDTKGSEDGARNAAKEAASDGCIVAIGPIGQRESWAAATEARVAQLPIAHLAPLGPAGNVSAGVFHFALSPEFEAEQAALVAVEEGYSRLAVLTPRDDTGVAQAETFVRTAELAGAKIVARGDYDPSSQSLESDVRRFLNLDPQKNRRLRRHFQRYGRKSWKSFSPDIEFELLYVPDFGSRAMLVVSYLPYLNVELRNRGSMSAEGLRRKHGGRDPQKVQLLGSQGWLGPDLAARGGSAIEGALIVSSCIGSKGHDRSEQSREFYDRYRQVTGQRASSVAVIAYDAMRMVLASLRQGGKREGRSSVRDALASARLRDGVCGSLQMGGQGQLLGEIDLLVVEAGSPEIYD